MSSLVPLLPGPARPVETQTTTPVTQTNIVLRKRLRPVSAACDECRKRKLKCNVPWPCEPCVLRNSECQFGQKPDIQMLYRALQRKFTEMNGDKDRLDSIVTMMREKPEDIALAIFRRVRTGADLEAILNSVEGGDLLMQLHLAPSSQFHYTLPNRCALPGIFAKTKSVYMDSLAFEAPYFSPESPQTFDARLISYLEAPKYMPYYSARLVEPLLDCATISRWTNVCTDEPLLHSLMEAYFLHIYSAFPFFHKECFLRGLGSVSRHFCSSLLVNAILAHACHATPMVAHRNEHWNPQTLGYMFLAEARRLLELETGRPKITTIQAMLVMNITMNDHGVEGAAYQYLTKAVALAYLMGLFNSASEQEADQDVKVVFEVTAWALFAWQGIMSSMLQQSPLVKQPPQTPHPAEFPFWYGDIQLRYPSSQEPVSTKYHQAFKAYLEFWTIFNDIGLFLFRPVQVRSLYLGQAVEFYVRLRSWFDGLPDDLYPGKIVLPFQLKLHIQYWALVTDLFKPFTGWDDPTKSLGQTPSEIYADARRNQELLLRIYYLRHGTETHDSWLSMFLPRLGFLALQEVASSSDDGDSLATLILALTSLDNQGKCYFKAEFTLRTICAQMCSRDLETFKQFATFQDLDVPQAIASRLGLIKSSWPVNMDFTKEERKNIRDVAVEAIGMNLMDDE
ncbi:related to nitrate assimilation regulatory protein nirA [Fusarium fujikuroi IMI 58289]|uniref:Related to nitrate assimilation regulatory protein nirA n=1 Tax=Gibberella fujikuroi (strain CBS 195.34 / IMI 58289 / NRRL A-6831) TaxID=1279085 RepID=S0E585_GIBF5|nr:related to nitrate assimilation regulatory protein nirA [Fusarium fujikuroi IMI 58289]CCT69860.1 related to nitrate assimilation regulatory protein nirA [Fusarium fujikuroi IMI 58289]SCN86129.1 related to nitrate assimilation regulatory protein nirA [Fusarium fujikuroi]